ncbi:hypothetical protein I302_105781 [Kwoniella bestiolae CBS 10118]|uniref:Uncharacterized protein n=1 Tax=Kwoniella bestiolae CBS 10118 TaxID=1296100 RepID=A0A1B9G245_9TREE|nr:hypothetical protein I302_04903 [Kwoniella bestiolae CBS 10118]OCF25093.1 hypothetical protein I302_04903 [Kwoniella bestiolae CBS 10118]
MSDTSSASETDRSTAKSRSSRSRSPRSSRRSSSSRPDKKTLTYETKEGREASLTYWPSTSQRDSKNRKKWYVFNNSDKDKDESISTSLKAMSLNELKSSDNKGHKLLYKKIDKDEAISGSRSESRSRSRIKSRSGSSSRSRSSSKPQMKKLERFMVDDSTRVTITSVGTSEDDMKYHIIEERYRKGEGGETDPKWKPSAKSAALTWDDITAKDQKSTVYSKVAETMRKNGKDRYLPRKGGGGGSRGTSRSRSGERSSGDGDGRKRRGRRSRRSASGDETSDDDG